MAKYTSKPFEVEAIQYTGENDDEVAGLFGYVTHRDKYEDGRRKYIQLRGPSGLIFLTDGEYLVRTANGVISKADAQTFLQNFVKVEG